MMRDWFPEVVDPEILQNPEASIAKLSVKEIKAALEIRDIPLPGFSDPPLRETDVQHLCEMAVRQYV